MQDTMYSCKEVPILVRRVMIVVCRTEEGISILIAGGDKGRIGVVAIAKAGPVVVEAGIHYDGITKEQIQEVLGRLDEELEELLQRFWKEKE